MKPVEIYAHIYIPPNAKGLSWNLYFDEQIRLMKQSRLFEVANVNAIIVAPCWNYVNDFPIHKNGELNTPMAWIDRAVEYINLRYPQVNIVETRDAFASENLFEGVTLKHIHEKAKNTDANFLYIHTKGISIPRPCPSYDNWREVLNHYLITEWIHCVKKLEEVDVVGVRDHTVVLQKDTITSGNFWWARADHIRNLPDPLQTNLYNEDISWWPGGLSYRYGFEKWILFNNAKFHWAVDTKTNHYASYYFLEQHDSKFNN